MSLTKPKVACALMLSNMIRSVPMLSSFDIKRAEVSGLIHSFPQTLRLFIWQRPDEEFDLHQIEQVFQDCVDFIRETAEAGRASSSETLENTITAFVACALVS